MNLKWRQIGRPSPGGAILQIVGDPSVAAWAASPAGLFRSQEGAWSSVRQHLPLAQVGAVFARRRYILAAGLGGGAAFSLDGGLSWQLSRIEQTGAALSCIVASPNFWQDGVMLAGTQGDGMLRSTDSGRSWQLANFGLHSFTIFALAVAPTWGRKEVAFCGTADGVYRSPNGGRAWKPCGLRQQVILALAASPNFEQDATLLAGGEGGLFRSQDSGMSWTPLDLGFTTPPTVNALWFDPIGRAWMGTSEHGIWQSSDAGISWTEMENSPRSVLCLDGSAERVCAGTFEQGLFVSADGGAAWQPETGLAARRFQWLATLPGLPNADQTTPTLIFLAAGALEGLWLVADGGSDWLPLPGWGDDEHPLCMAVDGGGVWVGGSNGVWKTDHPASEFTLSLETSVAISDLSISGRLLWAGSLNGKLWVTGDGGLSWHTVIFPGEGGSLLALASAGDEVLLAVRDQRQRLVNIWRGQNLSDQVNDVRWELWLSEATSSEMVQLAFGGPGKSQWVAAVDTWCITSAPGGFQRSELPEARHFSQALTWWPLEKAWLALAGGGLWISHDLAAWQRLETNLPAADVVALQALQTGAPSLVALTVDGSLWLWQA